MYKHLEFVKRKENHSFKQFDPYEVGDNRCEDFRETEEYINARRTSIRTGKKGLSTSANTKQQIKGHF